MEEKEIIYRKIGVVMTGVGASSYFISMIIHFNRTFLLLSNLLFSGGILLVLKPEKSMKLFLSRKRIPATVCLAIGLILICFNFGLLGSLSQLVGAFLLFGGFIPYIFESLKEVPIIGEFIKKITIPDFIYQMNNEKLP